jgi:hypothetical protein
MISPREWAQERKKNNKKIRKAWWGKKNYGS